MAEQEIARARVYERFDSIPLDESNKYQEAQHDRFVAALEKHGSSVRAWPAMASELGWPAEDVKVYAYSYFKRLVRDRDEDRCEDVPPAKKDGGGRTEEGKLRPSTNATIPSSSWSFHELVLLDSLMLKYCQDMGCLDAKRGSEEGAEAESSDFVRRRTVWESIAAQFPGKTAMACKEKGRSRLLNVFHGSHNTTK